MPLRVSALPVVTYTGGNRRQIIDTLQSKYKWETREGDGCVLDTDACNCVSRASLTSNADILIKLYCPECSQISFFFFFVVARLLLASRAMDRVRVAAGIS